jgi:hypothetical protein
MLERTRRCGRRPSIGNGKTPVIPLNTRSSGYIVGQQLNDQPITLYYAFSSAEMAKSALPYFYSGVIKGIEPVNQGQPLQKVTFGNVH